MSANDPTESSGPQFPSVRAAGERSATAAAARPSWQRAMLGSAGAALLLVLLAGALLFIFVFAGAASSATEVAYRYVPSDAAFAVELRVDMPGDQRSELADLASGFPDFEGGLGVFEHIDRMLNDGVQEIAGPGADYSSDVAPWFREWIVVAGPAEAFGEGPAAGLLMLGVRDREAAQEALPRLRGAGEWASEAYRDEMVWSTDDAGDGPAAYVLLDDVLMLGSSADALREALDVGAGEQPSLLSEARFADPWRAMPAGRLAAFWIDAQQMDALPRPSGPLPMEPLSGACAEMVPQPATQSGVVYLRDGRAHLETTAVYPDGEELPANTDTRLAERVPADAFVFAQHADVGSQASHLADCLRDSRGGGQAGEALEGLGDHLELIENLDAWAAGGALVVRYDGSRLGAGALIRIEDEARAQAALAELRSTLAEAPGVVSITESEHAGITIIDVTFKADADGPGREPAAPDAVLSWALTNDTLVIGMDGSFTRAVLDTTAETSLRNDAAYRAATEASGGFSHAGSAYLDMQAALTVSRAFELGRGSDQGDEEFLGAIDNVVAVGRVNGRSITTHVVLTPLE